ncbi:hypothetical protein D3C80_1790450 [compost metagenome]
MLGFDQEHGLVVDLGLHGRGHCNFIDAFGHGSGFDAQLDVHAGLLLLEQDGGRIGLLKRQILEVNALDLEYGIFLVGHGVGLSH